MIVGATPPLSYHMHAPSFTLERSAAGGGDTPSRGGQLGRQRDGRPTPPSQTRASGITALGSSDMPPRAGPGLSDVRPLQRVRIEKFPKDAPGERPTARTPVEPLAPGPPNATVELPQTAEVRRAPVVLVVASEYRVEGPPLLHERVMTVALAPRRSPSEAPAQPLPHGPNVEREVPPPATPTNMGKPEKVKGPRLRPPLCFPLRQRVPPKLDQAGLVPVARQPVFLAPPPKHRAHFLRIRPILNTETEVVRVPDFVRLPT